MEKLAGFAPMILSVLRIVAALLFVEHGAMKLLHYPAPMPGPGMDHIAVASQLGIAGLIELIGGGLIAVGLFTRFAAFIASGEMAAAYFMVHVKQSFFPALNMGDAAILFCFVFLYVVFAGPGPISLDAVLKRSR